MPQRNLAGLSRRRIQLGEWANLAILQFAKVKKMVSVPLIAQVDMKLSPALRTVGIRIIKDL
jgi:hypothetical protein